MSANKEISKQNLDNLLFQVAKEYKKLNGKKMPAEIVLIGGAAIITNYGFRDSTTDVDALIEATHSMKDAINIVGDRNSLPNGWLNADFVMTNSYTPKISQYSEYYKSFAYVLNVRVVTREYLVAMKLMSVRQYKNDISDIVGILGEEKDNGTPITIEEMENAVNNLYGDWSKLPQYSRDLIEKLIENDKFDGLYQKYKNEETAVKNSLLEFEEKYPKVMNSDNVSDIVAQLNKKRKSKSKGMSL